MRYRIGYKDGKQWRYFECIDNIKVAMNRLENLANIGYTQLSLKILNKTEVLKNGI